MKIILDAMGGDLAPEAAVLGALEAHRDFGAEITLVGRGEEILGVMRKHQIQDLPKGLEIAHADDVVDMHDDPAAVVHKRKNSSMIVGLKMLADGQADAFVSAGSTGALLTGATLLVKRVKGIRPGVLWPGDAQQDGGKDPHHRLRSQCGVHPGISPPIWGSGFPVCPKGHGYGLPQSGLLNNGTEDSKGPALQKEAYALLAQGRPGRRPEFCGQYRGTGTSLWVRWTSLSAMATPATSS